MKKFSFSLQSLLDVKLALEKQQESELALAQERLDRLRDALAALRGRLEEERRIRMERMRRRTDAAELHWQDIGFKALFERIERQQETVSVAEEERNRVQKKLVDTMGERKMLERLRDKQMEQYKEDLRREEAVMIDDFLSNKLSARTDAAQI